MIRDCNNKIRLREEKIGTLRIARKFELGGRNKIKNRR